MRRLQIYTLDLIDILDQCNVHSCSPLNRSQNGVKYVDEDTTFFGGWHFINKGC